MIVQTTLNEETNPSLETNLKNLQNNLKKQVQAASAISTFVPRIYKIVSINDSESSLVINFHVSNTIESITWGTYAELQNFFSTQLKTFKYVDFLSVDQCMGMQYKISDDFAVLWPAMPIGQVASKPLQDMYCVGPNGLILRLYCEGK